MKKVISLLLSALLVLSVMPMMLASAKVESQWNVMYDWEQYSSKNEFPELYDVGVNNYNNETKVDYTNYAGIATITNATNYPLAQTNRLEGSVKAFDFQQNAVHTVGAANAYDKAAKIKLDTAKMAQAKDLRFYMCYEVEKDKDGNLVNQVIGIKLKNGEVRFQNGWNDKDENGETMNSKYCQKWNWYSFVGKSYKLCSNTSDILEITEENVSDITEIVLWNRVNTEEIKSGSRRNYTYFDNVEYLTEVEVEEDGATTSAVVTEDKASIRLDTDVQGIRFYSTINTEGLDVAEAGTLIGPANLIGNYLTFEDVDVENAVKVKYDLSKGLYDDKYVVGSIVDIKETNYARDFVARAYVVLKDGTVVYSETTSTRNMAQIADAYIADANGGYAELDVELKAKVETWASAND